MSYKRNISLQFLFICLSFVAFGYLMLLFQWNISSDFHSAIEMIGLLFALIAGVSGILHFVKIGNMFYLFVGLGFFISGIEDFIHGVLGLFEPQTLSLAPLNRLFTGTSITGRLALSFLIILALLLEKKHRHITEHIKTVKKYSFSTFVVVILITIFIAFQPIPNFVLFSKLIFHPVDFFSAVTFLLAFIMGFRRLLQKKDSYTNFLLISILLNVIGQVCISFSSDFFDSLYLITHIMHLLSYIMPIIGLMTVILKDHYELVNAKKELQESEAQLKALLFSTPDYIMVLDHDGFIQKINKLYPGYSKEDCIGRNIDIFFDPDSRGKFKEAMMRIVETGELQELEIAVTHPDGIHYYLNRLSPGSAAGEDHSIIFIATDISQLKNTENKLKENDEFLKLVITVSNDGVWDWDIAYDTVKYDDQYYRMAGYEPGEYPGNLNEWKKRIHPEDFDRMELTLEQHLTGARNSHNAEFRYLHKNGEYMWIRGRGKIVKRDENNKPLRMIGTHSDITEKKNSEVKLEDSLKTAQHMNNLMTDREMRIIKMKIEVNELLGELGRVARYRSVELW